MKVNWTRTDSIVAFVRLVRRPVSLAEITTALDGNMASTSAAVSSLYQQGELNREQKPGSNARWRYVYTDPAYDELLATREVVEAARIAASHDCEEPTYTLMTALDKYDKAMKL